MERRVHAELLAFGMLQARSRLSNLNVGPDVDRRRLTSHSQLTHGPLRIASSPDALAVTVAGVARSRLHSANPAELRIG